MNYHLGLKPLLWLRTLLLYALLSIAILLGVLYVAANSPVLAKQAAKQFAPDYNISYSRIHGTFWGGIEIENVAYNDEVFCDSMLVKWNPLGLLSREVIVNKLLLSQVDVGGVQTLMDAFAGDKEPKTQAKKSDKALEIGVTLEQVSLSLSPFVDRGVRIDRAVLGIDSLHYTHSGLTIGEVQLKVESNVTTLDLQASLKEQRVGVEKLSLEAVDTLALQSVLGMAGTESNTTEKVSKKKATVPKESENLLIPKEVYIENASIDLLPRVFDPLHIDTLHLTIENGLFSIASLMLQKADLNLSATSNLTTLAYDASVEENQLSGELRLSPTKRLFTRYELPLQKRAIGDIIMELNVSKEHLSALLNTQMKQLLNTPKGAFNLDVNRLHSYLNYDFATAELRVDSHADITTPYAKDVYVTNHFRLGEQMAYSGKIDVQEIRGVDAKFSKVLKELTVAYQSRKKGIETQLDSKNLTGYFNFEAFQDGVLHLETKQAVQLNEMLTLPPELNTSKVMMVVDAPVSFEANASQYGKVALRSNVVNMDINVSYADVLKLHTLTRIPKDSLLKPYAPALKWEKLNPIGTDIALHEGKVEMNLHTAALAVQSLYDTHTTQIDGRITFGLLDAKLLGFLGKSFSLSMQVDALDSLLKEVEALYVMKEVPLVKGSAKLDIEVKGLKTAELRLKSPKVRYQSGRRSQQVVENIDLLMQLDASKIVLKHYAFMYAKQNLFATKPSMVTFDESNITIAPFWVNDTLRVTGSYDIQQQKGSIKAKAEKYHLKHALAELDSSIDIQTQLEGNKTSITGEVILLGGDLRYDLDQKSYASDSDIVIVQEMKKKQESPFMDGLSVNVQVKTQKPLRYKEGDINIKLKTDLSLHKSENADLMVLGSIALPEGGRYTFEEKNFWLNKSHLFFTGNPANALLEASVQYQAVEHLITITVTGTASSPTISFSSKPYLSKEEILSIILFDSTAGAGTNSSEDMMKMMGGAMAKSALSNIGVKLDHLVLGEGNSIEVGKRLTNKITIIYVNDEVSSVKLKYDHSQGTESIMSVSEASQSYDIVFKKDF